MTSAHIFFLSRASQGFLFPPNLGALLAFPKKHGGNTENGSDSFLSPGAPLLLLFILPHFQNQCYLRHCEAKYKCLKTEDGNAKQAQTPGHR